MALLPFFDEWRADRTTYAALPDKRIVLKSYERRPGTYGSHSRGHKTLWKTPYEKNYKR